jgi:hypothetical protein
MGPRYSFKASADADGSMCFGENGVTPSTNDVTRKHDLWPLAIPVRLYVVYQVLQTI